MNRYETQLSMLSLYTVICKSVRLNSGSGLAHVETKIDLKTINVW